MALWLYDEESVDGATEADIYAAFFDEVGVLTDNGQRDNWDRIIVLRTQLVESLDRRNKEPR